MRRALATGLAATAAAGPAGLAAEMGRADATGPVAHRNSGAAAARAADSDRRHFALALPFPHPLPYDAGMSLVSEILSHNAEFVKRRDYEPYLTDRFPDKRLVVLSCM